MRRNNIGSKSSFLQHSITICFLSFLLVCQVFLSLELVKLFSKLIDTLLNNSSFSLDSILPVLLCVLLICSTEILRRTFRNKCYVKLLQFRQSEYLSKLSSLGTSSLGFDARQQIVGESLQKTCLFSIDSVPSFAGSVFQALSYFVFGLFINPVFSAIILGFSVFVVILQNNSAVKKQDEYEEGEQNESILLGFIRRTINNHEIIQTMLDEEMIADMATEKMAARNNSWLKSLIPLFRTSSIGTATFHLTGFFSIVLGAVFHFQGLISIGEVFAFYQIASNVTNAFARMTTFFISKTEYKGVRSFRESFFSEEQKETVVSDISRADINISEVSFKYPSQEKKAVSNITFSFSLGKLYCIRGANGSGKSTLGLLISNMLQPSSGSISFPRNPIFYFSSNNCFLPLSVAQNIIGLNDNESVQTLKSEMMKFGGELTERLSLRLEEKMSIDGSPFSAGEKQMILFMKALHVISSFDESSFVIFDEISSSMDDDSRKRVARKMKSLADNGNCVIFITHDCFDKMNFDENLNMAEGMLK